MLKGLEAKEFFQNAFSELESIARKQPIDEQKFLNKKIGGYWKDGDYWVAFDNYSNTLNIEEFDIEDEAIKYANGDLALTKQKYLI